MARSLSILLLFLLFATHITLGQNADTLLKKARIVYDNDPAKGIRLTRLAYNTAFSQHLKPQQLKAINLLSVRLWDIRNNKEAHRVVQQGLLLANKYGIDSLTGDLWVTAGLIDYSDGLNSNAIKKYEKAVVCFKNSRHYKKLGITYVNLGICEKRLSNYERANAYYFKAAEVFQHLNDQENLCGVYNSIGNCFLSLNNHSQAITYYKSAFSLSTKLQDKETQAQSLNNLGYGYKQMGIPDSAIKYLTACLRLRVSVKDSGELVLTLQNLGSVWKQKGDVKKAMYFINRSMNIARQYHMQEELVRGYLDQAEIYIQQHAPIAAIAALNPAGRLTAVLQSPELQDQIYKLHASAAEQQGNYKRALAFQKQHEKLSDSLFNIKQHKNIEEIATRYQVKQKDHDIATLRIKGTLEQQVLAKQRSFIVVLIVAVLLTLLLVLVLYRSYQHKRADHQHIQHLMKELHHRVKNNLQMLSGIFSLQLADTTDELVRNSIQENEMRINSMNIIHQKLYDAEMTTSVNIRDYINDLLKYLQLSYGIAAKKIEFRVEVEPLLVAADKVVPIGLIINELITNACKYAFGTQGGIIGIGFKLEEEKCLVLTVMDNGRGKKYGIVPAGNSFGTRLVEIMARQLNAKFTLTEGTGLHYRFEIPD